MTTQSFPGVEYDAGTGGDIFLGNAAALIAAGLLTSEQIPESGFQGGSGTFVDGVLQPRYAKAPHDERWMHVAKYSTSIRLTKGIPTEEKRRRQVARQAELEEFERNQPKKDIGIDGARKAYAEASTQFVVGDKVWLGNAPAVVTGEYKLRSVCWPEGEFIDAKGERISYQYGYTCQYRNGEEYFFAAHQLSNEQGGHTHLRLVSGVREQEERLMLAFRGH